MDIPSATLTRARNRATQRGTSLDNLLHAYIVNLAVEPKKEKPKKFQLPKELHPITKKLSQALPIPDNGADWKEARIQEAIDRYESLS